jgi:DNA-binding CsgD family transcriptional regulator
LPDRPSLSIPAPAAQDDDALIALAEAMRSAQDPFVPFSGFLTQRGISGFFYAFASLRSDIVQIDHPKAFYHRHTYPDEWDRAVGAQALVENDHTVAAIYRGAQCVAWLPRPYGEFVATLPPVQRAQFEAEADIGLLYGASLLLESGTSLAGLGVWQADVTSAQDFTREWAEHGAALWRAGQLLDVAVRGERPNLLIRLTPREIDCLAWLARGQRPAEICWRLGIAEKTFEKHIANAKSKLKARTRDQALAKAVLLNLLPL